MEKLVIIDGNSLINRAFYALPMLTNFNGEVSNAVFGFTNIIVKIINEIKPKYMCVAFDYGKKTFRNNMFDGYKGTRKPTPPELKSQFPILKNLLSAMNIKFIEKEGIEADDIIGTLTKKFDCENIIVTGDKDSFQLINNNTWVMFTKKGVTETINYTPSKLYKDYGIEPYQVVELKSLMGDSSDNIPGVKGIGEKTAVNLLTNYNTLDGVYNNIDKITGSVKTKLLGNKDMAYLSHELATIKCDCDIEVKLEELTYNFPFNSEVLNYFKRYQFNSLLKKKDLFSEISEEDKIELSTESCEQQKLNSIEDFKNLTNLLQKQKQFYLVFEDDFSVYASGVEYTFESKFDLLSPMLEYSDVLNILKPALENSEIKKIVYNYKDLLHKLNKFNIELNGVTDDVLIERYLINNNSKPNVKLLDVVTEQLLNEKYLAFNIKLLHEKYIKLINELELEKLYKTIEMPLSLVLFKMEKSGFKLDRNELLLLDEKYEKELADLTKEIYELAGTEFNINSPKQLGEILFDKLKLVAYNNKKKSTNIDVLTQLESDHPIINKLIRYRKISKLYSTYVKAFQNLMDSNNDKIYTLFNQTLTSTGRLSSSEPNLQNIPVRTDEGKNLRKVFIPSNENGYIVSADYSQIELRLLAAFSGDPTLIESFRQGNDIHATTASQVFGVKLSDVTSQMRRDAKAINFGIVYGISDYGLSQNIGTTRKAAADYIKKYFERYPLVKTYMDKNIEVCRQNGYVKTVFGRIRYIPEINNSNYNLKLFGERAAMNMPLQGSASDIIKLAMIKVQNELENKKLKSKLILQIHDELIIDCDKSELEAVKDILKNCMENVIELPVKLEVNISYGKNWYEAK